MTESLNSKSQNSIHIFINDLPISQPHQNLHIYAHVHTTKHPNLAPAKH